MLNVGQKGNAKVVIHNSNRLKASDQQRVTLPATLLRHAVKHPRIDFCVLTQLQQLRKSCAKSCVKSTRATERI